jgi:hydrogenase maturation protease
MERLSPMASILIIGIGNEHRGDDAIGLLAARHLRERLQPRLREDVSADDLSVNLQNELPLNDVSMAEQASEGASQPAPRKKADAAVVSVVEHSGEGASLMDLWKNADTAIVIDAMCSGAPIGSVQRFDASLAPMPASTFRSTHDFSLADAIELSRVLAQLPRCLIVYGIEAANFSPGSDLSPAVQAALDGALHQVLSDLR